MNSIDRAPRTASEGTIAARYPSTPVTTQLETHGSLLSNAPAKQDLDWSPSHSWRDHV